MVKTVKSARARRLPRPCALRFPGISAARLTEERDQLAVGRGAKGIQGSCQPLGGMSKIDENVKRLTTVQRFEAARDAQEFVGGPLEVLERRSKVSRRRYTRRAS